LNGKLERLDALTQKDKAAEDRAFRATFQLLDANIADDAFCRYDPGKQRFLGSFLISGFEAIALGIGFNSNSDGSLKPIQNITDKIKSIWSHSDFTSNSGSGVRASIRIPKIVPLGRQTFSK